MYIRFIGRSDFLLPRSAVLLLVFREAVFREAVFREAAGSLRKRGRGPPRAQSPQTVPGAERKAAQDARATRLARHEPLLPQPPTCLPQASAQRTGRVAGCHRPYGERPTGVAILRYGEYVLWAATIAPSGDLCKAPSGMARRPCLPGPGTYAPPRAVVALVVDTCPASSSPVQQRVRGRVQSGRAVGLTGRQYRSSCVPYESSNAGLAGNRDR